MEGDFDARAAALVAACPTAAETLTRAVASRYRFWDANWRAFAELDVLQTVYNFRTGIAVGHEALGATPALLPPAPAPAQDGERAAAAAACLQQAGPVLRLEDGEAERAGKRPREAGDPPGAPKRARGTPAATEEQRAEVNARFDEIVNTAALLGVPLPLRPVMTGDETLYVLTRALEKAIRDVGRAVGEDKGGKENYAGFGRRLAARGAAAPAPAPAPAPAHAPVAAAAPDAAPDAAPAPKGGRRSAAELRPEYAAKFTMLQALCEALHVRNAPQLEAKEGLNKKSELDAAWREAVTTICQRVGVPVREKEEVKDLVSKLRKRAGSADAPAQGQAQGQAQGRPTQTNLDAAALEPLPLDTAGGLRLRTDAEAAPEAQAAPALNRRPVLAGVQVAFFGRGQRRRSQRVTVRDAQAAPDARPTIVEELWYDDPAVAADIGGPVQAWDTQMLGTGTLLGRFIPTRNILMVNEPTVPRYAAPPAPADGAHMEEEEEEDDEYDE